MLFRSLDAAGELEKREIKARVVSAPCLEWFREQDSSYRDSVLPKSVRARVSIEAGISQGWREFIGDCGESISIEHFGASASAARLFSEFGFTVERVVAAALKSIESSRSR